MKELFQYRIEARRVEVKLLEVWATNADDAKNRALSQLEEDDWEVELIDSPLTSIPKTEVSS